MPEVSHAEKELLDRIREIYNDSVGGNDPQPTIVQRYNAMRIQRDEAVKAQIEFGNRNTAMHTEYKELKEKTEQLQTELSAKPDEAAFLKLYGIESREDLNRQFTELKGDIEKACDEVDESAQKLASAVQTQKENNENWSTLFKSFINGDVDIKNVAPILDQFNLSQPLELRGAAGNSESFLANEYFTRTDHKLKDAGLALLPSSTVAQMLTVALRRRPISSDAIDDMQEVQAGLRSIQQSMNVEPTRPEQELFIKVVLIWLHHILETETSGLRLGMAIGLLTGILDIIDPTLTFLQGFCGQLEKQLRKGLLPMAMSLRCMRRMQYTPHFWAMPVAFNMSENFDFGRSIPQIGNELYQNNKKSFHGDFVFLSENFGGDTYTSMTLLYDDPRHQEFILFERADHSVVFWRGKWLFRHDYKGEIWEVRLDPAPAVDVILKYKNDHPLAAWMAEYHSEEYMEAYYVAYDTAKAK